MGGSFQGTSANALTANGDDGKTAVDSSGADGGNGGAYPFVGGQGGIGSLSNGQPGSFPGGGGAGGSGNPDVNLGGSGAPGVLRIYY